MGIKKGEKLMPKIGRVVVCLDCDEVFDGERECPYCLGRSHYPLRKWIPPLDTPFSLSKEKNKNILNGRLSRHAVTKREIPIEKKESIAAGTMRLLNLLLPKNA
jgi:hypothetical protein